MEEIACYEDRKLDKPQMLRFGDYKVSDPAYDKLGFTIHNYFFGVSVS